LETLSGFQKGASTYNTAKVYRDFLSKSILGFDADVAVKFHQDVRNRLLHDTETAGNWLIEKDIPMGKIVEKDSSGNFRLNRTRFHNALRKDFEDWITRLRNGDQDLRKNMRKRMEEAIAKHSKSSLE